MEWKDDDEVTTTFGSIKLAQNQAFELGAEFGRNNALSLTDAITGQLEQLKSITKVAASWLEKGTDPEQAMREIIWIIVEEND